MIILGLLIAAAAAAFAALLIAYNTSGGPEYTVTMFDRDVVTLDSLAIFVSGLAIALIFCAGLALAATGPRTRRRLGAGRATDAELRARAERHAATGEWQADPTADRVAADKRDAPAQEPPPPRPDEQPPQAR